MANYIDRCLECQKVKTKHRHPVGLLQPLPIMEWKWEFVTMYFITKLAKTVKQHDSIMVVVDKLTKTTHFILVKTAHKATNIPKIYIKEVARLHGVLKETNSDRHYLQIKENLKQSTLQQKFKNYELKEDGLTT